MGGNAIVKTFFVGNMFAQIDVSIPPVGTWNTNERPKTEKLKNIDEKSKLCTIRSLE